jgi:hypothetical protein
MTTTTTVYRSGDISNRIANGIIAGIADYYNADGKKITETQAQQAAEKRFDEIVKRDYPTLFLSWYPSTSSVLGDYNADYSEVNFDAIFDEIGNCYDNEYPELVELMNK